MVGLRAVVEPEARLGRVLGEGEPPRAAVRERRARIGVGAGDVLASDVEADEEQVRWQVGLEQGARGFGGEMGPALVEALVLHRVGDEAGVATDELAAHEQHDAPVNGLFDVVAERRAGVERMNVLDELVRVVQNERNDVARPSVGYSRQSSSRANSWLSPTRNDSTKRRLVAQERDHLRIRERATPGISQVRS